MHIKEETRFWLGRMGVYALLLGAAPIAWAELKPLEIRRHWTAKVDLAALPIPEEKKRELANQELPEASVIMRNWYREVPPTKKWTTAGVLRSETVVLFDLKRERVRFVWREEQEFGSGITTYELIAWKGDAHKRTVRFRVEGRSLGQDLASTLTEGRKRKQRGHLQADEETVVTIDLADRRLIMSVADWRQGRLSAEDRQWLRSVLDDTFIEMLRYINAITHTVPQLTFACYLATHPLLENYSQPCEFTKGPIDLLQGQANCEFDAGFGEPCTLDEELKSKFRKEPQLAPPPPTKQE